VIKPTRESHSGVMDGGHLSCEHSLQLIARKTTVAGHGRVAINTPGPVEMVEVDDSALRVQGRLVLGRTDGSNLPPSDPPDFRAT